MEEHARGEIIVAAMMNAFVELWSDRIAELGRFAGDSYNLDSVVEEGTKLAGHLLNMAIRALDYCPPTDLDFGQYLSALLDRRPRAGARGRMGISRGDPCALRTLRHPPPVPEPATPTGAGSAIRPMVRGPMPGRTTRR